MDPFTIATTVTKITTTCLTTGKAIYDLSCKYQDAPRNVVAISSEVAVISASLSQIQALVLSKNNPEQLLRSRPEVAATLDTSLTGCMVLFSCLDEEIREVSRHARGVGRLTWRGKVKTVWKEETFKELLDGIRGQQMAINTLIQLLQMESLTEITQLLQRNAPGLKKTVERTATLRRSHPSVKVAESIYSPDDRASVYSAADSVMAPSDFEFDFDDIIVNSTAYRRALAAARQQNIPSPLPEAEGDLIDFTDSNTIRGTGALPSTDDLAISEDLLGLRFAMLMDETKPPPDVNTKLARSPKPDDGPELEHVSLSRAQTRLDTSMDEPAVTDGAISSVEGLAKPTIQRTLSFNSMDELNFTGGGAAREYPLPGITGSPSSTSSAAQSKPVRTCTKCKQVLTGQFARAMEGTYHLECFTCEDCGKNVASKFFPISDQPPHQYPLCETDYFRRLDLLCHSCGEALRGSYVSAMDRKYHQDHFRCSAASCAVIFGAEDSYYEHDDQIFCWQHYVTLHAEICQSCEQPIVKQFVELNKGEKRQWHPECFMIHKYWEIDMAPLCTAKKSGDRWLSSDGKELDVSSLLTCIESAEQTITKIWRVLSAFEERLATSLSRISNAIEGKSPFDVLDMASLLCLCGSLFRALEQDPTQPHRHSRHRFRDDTGYVREKVMALIPFAIGRSSYKVENGKGSLIDASTLISTIARSTKSLIRTGLSTCCLSTDELRAHFLDSLSDKPKDYKQERFYRTHLSTLNLSTTCVQCNTLLEDMGFLDDGSPKHAHCLSCSKCHRFYGNVVQFTRISVAECRHCGAPYPKKIVFMSRSTVSLRQMWSVMASEMRLAGRDFDVLKNAELEPLELGGHVKEADGGTLSLDDIPKIVGEGRA